MATLWRTGIGVTLWVSAGLLLGSSPVAGAERAEVRQKSADQLLLEIMDLHARLATSDMFLAQAKMLGVYLEAAQPMEEAKRIDIYIKVLGILRKISDASDHSIEGPASDNADMDGIPDTEQVWVKCKACTAAYEINKRQYYREIRQKMQAASGAAMLMTPPLTCQKCSRNTVFLAEKCPNCAEIFFVGSVPNDFPDRCPKCKRSKTEDARKARIKKQ